jgi:hypothetical protein
MAREIINRSIRKPMWKTVFERTAPSLVSRPETIFPERLVRENVLSFACASAAAHFFMGPDAQFDQRSGVEDRKKSPAFLVRQINTGRLENPDPQAWEHGPTDMRFRAESGKLNYPPSQRDRYHPRYAPRRVFLSDESKWWSFESEMGDLLKPFDPSREPGRIHNGFEWALSRLRIRLAPATLRGKLTQELQRIAQKSFDEHMGQPSPHSDQKTYSVAEVREICEKMYLDIGEKTGKFREAKGRRYEPLLAGLRRLRHYSMFHGYRGNRKEADI